MHSVYEKTVTLWLRMLFDAGSFTASQDAQVVNERSASPRTWGPGIHSPDTAAVSTTIDSVVASQQGYVAPRMILQHPSRLNC